ncbi:MAG TPA: GNAT family N-acetyltransferase [Candidatus Dormibacteraeota bacterium]|nr:GNAT family N-acetyltransferase [Candidatus Dormibacteraeota bacterium]
MRSKLWAADLRSAGLPSSPSAVEVIEIKPPTAEILIAAMGAEGDRVASRFARGCRSFAALHRGTLAAYGWLSTETEWIGELGIAISPAAGEAYVWNCFTLPAFRRQGHYRALLEGTVAHARAEGLKRLWIGSIHDPAEKADADAGFAPVLHFTVVKLGPVRWLRASDAPDAPAGLPGEARRRLGLGRRSVIGRVAARIH